MTDATPEQMLLDSKLVGCMIRGLSSSALEDSDDGKFNYINCLDREYLTKPLNIKCVTFNISRYGQYTYTIEFPELVSEKEAIEKMEEYMSEPLTEEYYATIVDDLFHGESWEQAREWFKCRGDCLTDCKFLESTTVEDGELTFFIGS